MFWLRKTKSGPGSGSAVVVDKNDFIEVLSVWILVGCVERRKSRMYFSSLSEDGDALEVCLSLWV